MFDLNVKICSSETGDVLYAGGWVEMYCSSAVADPIVSPSSSERIKSCILLQDL